jgi:hypothetical protein
MSGRRRNERDMDAPSDGMILVGLCESEVPPDREARCGRGLLDLKLVQRRRENAAGERKIGHSKCDVVEHGA